MKNISFKQIFKSEDRPQNAIATRGGSYSLVITLVVLAILVVINIMASSISSAYTKLDISSSQLYSITSNTKVVVNNLQKDVTIYWIVQADEEDSVIENLLEKYESLSDHIKVVKKNPDVYPTFAQQYTDDTVMNNSLVVECGDVYRYISYADIYLADVDYTTYSYVYSFDGEGAITSAIDYVVSEDLPVVYTLTGHGEEDLPEEFAKQIERENTETAELSLLTVDEIPEDAACILIYAPTSDISSDEKDMLSEYVEKGGKLMVVSSTQKDTSLDNLNSIAADYSVTVNDGLVVEGDRSHYAMRMPYVMIPDLGESDITESLIEAGYYVIMPVAQGLTVGDSSNATVTQLLTTSAEAYSKSAGYNIETYEKEDGDVDGPFALAVDIETNSGGSIIWIASSQFLDEMYNAYSSGANTDFAMNALSSLVGETEAVAIRSKSLGYNYLTISEDVSGKLKAMMIFVIPAVFVAAGIYVTVSRRRKKNEQV